MFNPLELFKIRAFDSFFTLFYEPIKYFDKVHTTGSQDTLFIDFGFIFFRIWMDRQFHKLPNRRGPFVQFGELPDQVVNQRDGSLCFRVIDLYSEEFSLVSFLGLCWIALNFAIILVIVQTIFLHLELDHPKTRNFFDLFSQEMLQDFEAEQRGVQLANVVVQLRNCFSSEVAEVAHRDSVYQGLRSVLQQVYEGQGQHEQVFYYCDLALLHAAMIKFTDILRLHLNISHGQHTLNDWFIFDIFLGGQDLLCYFFQVFISYRFNLVFFPIDYFSFQNSDFIFFFFFILFLIYAFLGVSFNATTDFVYPLRQIWYQVYLALEMGGFPRYHLGEGQTGSDMNDDLAYKGSAVFTKWQLNLTRKDDVFQSYLLDFCFSSKLYRVLQDFEDEEEFEFLFYASAEDFFFFVLQPFFDFQYSILFILIQLKDREGELGYIPQKNPGILVQAFIRSFMDFQDFERFGFLDLKDHFSRSLLSNLYVQEDIHGQYQFDFLFFNYSTFFFLFLILIVLFFYLNLGFLRLKKIFFLFFLFQSFEALFKIILDILTHVKGKQFFVFLLIFLFLIIVSCNFFGLIPYSFALTSYFSVTFFFSFIFFFTLFFIGILLHGLQVLNLFIPPGTPFLILPLLFCIEVISYFARVFSLAIRLFANITAGHILLYIFSQFVSLLFDIFVASFIGFSLISILWILEAFISVLQAYVFVVLITLYLNEVLYLEH